MDSPRTVAITGANGLVGSTLCEEVAAHGWKVRAGVRRTEGYAGLDEAFRCDLPEHLDENAIASADVVIHAAWTMRFRSAAEAKRVNIGGSARVVRAARRGKTRVVFVSSCSAHGRRCVPLQRLGPVSRS